MLYVGDFETTKNPDGSMRVWLADMCAIAEPYEHYTFTSIEGTFVWLEEVKPEAVYFHNLKFDGSYIMSYLNDAGYKFTDDRKLMPGQYNFLVTDRNIWFLGAICWQDGTITQIRDSLKKIPLPVRKIAEFYFLPCSKGEIDYNKERPIGYEPDEQERDYVRRDTEIVARALKIHFDRGMTGLTMPADAMNEYKRGVSFERMFRHQVLSHTQRR